MYVCMCVCVRALQEGGASLARFSPDGETLAVVVAGGHVCFWELNLEERGTSRVSRITVHCMFSPLCCLILHLLLSLSLSLTAFPCVLSVARCCDQ